MKNYNKTEAISIITKAAYEYNEQLNNRHFMMVYRLNGFLEKSTIDFRNFHFKHLTGVKSTLSAVRFFEICLNRKLSEKDFDFSRDGNTQRKLSVLHLLPSLFSGNSLVGDFIGSGIKVSADYFVGGTKHYISLGCRYGNTTDMPVTLYCESIKKLSHNPVKIVAVFRKHYSEMVYADCTYLAKDESEALLRQALFSET